MLILSGRGGTETTSAGYSQFAKSVASRSELVTGSVTRSEYTPSSGNSLGPPAVPTEPPRYTPSYSGYKPTATVTFDSSTLFELREWCLRKVSILCRSAAVAAAV